MKRNQISRRTILISAAIAALPLGAVAQDNSPIEWIVGYPPGGASDNVVRILVEQMSKSIGRTIVVVNKSGAATAIAAQYVATAKTPMLLSADFATLAATPNLFSKLAYDPDKDFAPVGMMARSPMLLLAGPSVPAKNLTEFVAWAKSQPEPVTFASAGPGSPHHLIGEQVNDMLGLKMVHVPYRGGNPALLDMMGGQVQTGMMDLGSAAPYLTSKKLKALGVTTNKRLSLLPDVPTFAEQGYADYEAYAWTAIMVSKATPADLRLKLNAALNAALNSPEAKAQLQVFGVEGMPTTPEFAVAYSKAERERWGAVIRKNNIKID